MGKTKSLRDKATGDLTNNVERCDILYSLLRQLRSPEGSHVQTFPGCGPDEIMVSQDNEVRFADVEGPGNLALLPPESLSACVSGQHPPWDVPQKNFTLGMLAYFMCSGGRDYYETKDLRIVNLQDGAAPGAPATGNACLISPEDVKHIPFGRAVSMMTAYDPAARQQGVRMFLQYLLDHVPSWAVVKYVYEGTVIHEHTEKFAQGVYELPLQRELQLDSGTYRLIPGPGMQGGILYRPGEHTYRIHVTKLGEEKGVLLQVQRDLLTHKHDDAGCYDSIRLDSGVKDYALTIPTDRAPVSIRVFLVVGGTKSGAPRRLLIPAPKQAKDAFSLRFSYDPRGKLLYKLTDKNGRIVYDRCVIDLKEDAL